jgi:hypothetical protein
LLGDDDDRYDHNMQYLLGEHCFGVSEWNSCELDSVAILLSTPE